MLLSVMLLSPLLLSLVITAMIFLQGLGLYSLMLLSLMLLPPLKHGVRLPNRTCELDVLLYCRPLSLTPASLCFLTPPAITINAQSPRATPHLQAACTVVLPSAFFHTSWLMVLEPTCYHHYRYESELHTGSASYLCCCVAVRFYSHELARTLWPHLLSMLQLRVRVTHRICELLVLLCCRSRLLEWAGRRPLTSPAITITTASPSGTPHLRAVCPVLLRPTFVDTGWPVLFDPTCRYHYSCESEWHTASSSCSGRCVSVHFYHTRWLTLFNCFCADSYAHSLRMSVSTPPALFFHLPMANWLKNVINLGPPRT